MRKSLKILAVILFVLVSLYLAVEVLLFVGKIWFLYNVFISGSY